MYNFHAHQRLEENCIQFCGKLLVGWNSWGFMFWELLTMVWLQTENWCNCTQLLQGLCTRRRTPMLLTNALYFLYQTHPIWWKLSEMLGRKGTYGLVLHYGFVVNIIQCEGYEIIWSHLWEIYHKNRSQTDPGLALVPKLKFEHVYLSSFSKTRVDLATQVWLHILPWKAKIVTFLFRCWATLYPRHSCKFLGRRLEEQQLLLQILTNFLTVSM